MPDIKCSTIAGAVPVLLYCTTCIGTTVLLRVVVLYCSTRRLWCTLNVYYSTDTYREVRRILVV